MLICRLNNVNLDIKQAKQGLLTLTFGKYSKIDGIKADKVYRISRTPFFHSKCVYSIKNDMARKNPTYSINSLYSAGKTLTYKACYEKLKKGFTTKLGSTNKQFPKYLIFKKIKRIKATNITTLYNEYTAIYKSLQF